MAARSVIEKRPGPRIPLPVDESKPTEPRPWHRRTTVIAASPDCHPPPPGPSLRSSHASECVALPLFITLVLGGVPLLYDLLRKLLKREFGSDLLAGISIVTSVLLGEYLAGVVVVLMLSGGEALESYAVAAPRRCWPRWPGGCRRCAHRQAGRPRSSTCRWQEVAVGDALVVFPHEICPVDGVVIEGHGVMDESYLTGEPFQMSKAPGSDGALRARSTAKPR